MEIHVSPTGSGLPHLLEMVSTTRRMPDTHPVRLGRCFWGLDYHLEDAGDYSLDGATWSQRRKFTAHLYAPGRHFWERSRADDIPFPETYFIFRTEGRSALDERVSHGSGFARFDDTEGVLRGILEHHIPGAHPNRNMYFRAQGLLLLVVDCLASARHIEGCNYDIPSPDAAKVQTLATRVNQYLLAHYHEPVVLDDIARRVGVSRSTLTHGYREETGVSPMAHLMTCRLDAARSMILKGERLKSVALRTGFYDEYHLSKAFKRRFGHSPRAYRQGIH